jgi:RND family efflux transporter MFP subunit
MKIKRYINVIIGVLFLAAAVALWAMPSDMKTPPRSAEPTRVALGQVRSDRNQRAVRFAGVTQAKNRAELSFAVPARVAVRPVVSGSQVTEGSVLARLDDREFRNAVNLAQAALTELKAQWQQARRDHHRFEALTSAHVTPVAELEKAATRQEALEASLEAAAARLKEARRLLGETVLRAPFSGTVTGISIQPGEWALPGRPVVELTGDGAIELVVEVPESVVTHLRPDQAVKVQLPFADDRVVSGHIRTVARAAISAGRLFPVKVDLAATPGLAAGMTAQLLLDLDTENALTVPLAAVVNPGASDPCVFLYDQGRVLRRPVELGPIIGEGIVVRGDFSAGDQVVITGQSQLTDGEHVEVAL